MKTNNILAVGTVATDNVKTPAGEVKKALGGSVSYFAAAARFFSKVSVVAVVGEDFPPKYFKLLKGLKIDTSGIEVRKGKTFSWSGFYGEDLNQARTLETQLNVLASFDPILSPKHKKSKVVFLANIDPAIQLAVLRQVKSPTLTACDTMNYWIDTKLHRLRQLLRKVDIFLCNDAEAKQLSGLKNLLAASRWLMRHGPKIVIIKKGEHGVVCASRDFTFMAPAYWVPKVLDPTGAGDAFAGGFVGFLAKAKRLNEGAIRQAVIYGSVLASYNVESFSLHRLVSLKMPQIRSRYKDFKALTRF